MVQESKMSEEEPLSEEEEVEKKLQICADLETVGEKALSKKLFAKIAEEIEIVQFDDWENTQICATFPKIDIRCFVFGCSPIKACPFRHMSLRYLGLTERDYREWKKELAKTVDDLLKRSK